MASKSYLGQGIKYPYQIDNYGRIATQDDLELIKQSLNILFSEPIGTELMREHYGSQVRMVLFQPNDIIAKSLLDFFIVDAISNWEKRIKIADILYEIPSNQPNVILCTIFFLVKQSSQIDSFVFPFIREIKN